MCSTTIMVIVQSYTTLLILLHTQILAKVGWYNSLPYCLSVQGNFSENDRAHWTPQLRKALNFDQTQALQVDNGVQLFMY